MKYEQIIALLEKGLTPAEITQLDALPDPKESEAPQNNEPEARPGKEPAENPVPEWAASLQMSIDRMTNALHANAIMQQQQPEQHVMTPEEALAEVIAPPKK